MSESYHHQMSRRCVYHEHHLAGRQLAWIPAVPFVNSVLQVTTHDFSGYKFPTRQYNLPINIPLAFADPDVFGDLRTGSHEVFGTATEHAVVAALSWLTGWSVGWPGHALSCDGLDECVGEAFEHGRQVFGLDCIGGRCCGGCSGNVGRGSAVGGRCAMQNKSGCVVDVLEVVRVIWKMVGELQLQTLRDSGP